MDEVRQSRSIKIKPSVLHKAHLEAIKEGKVLGRWIEDAIEEKIKKGDKK